MQRKSAKTQDFKTKHWDFIKTDVEMSLQIITFCTFHSRVGCVFAQKHMNISVFSCVLLFRFTRWGQNPGASERIRMHPNRVSENRVCRAVKNLMFSLVFRFEVHALGAKSGRSRVQPNVAESGFGDSSAQSSEKSCVFFSFSL